MKRILYLIILVVISTTMIRSSGGCKKLNNPPINTSNAVVTTFAGPGFGNNYYGGILIIGSFEQPSGVAVDKLGYVYVADAGNDLILKISQSGTVSVFAGSGTAGFADGVGAAASFSGPAGVAVDATGNVYVADEGNEMIRKISPSGVVTTLAGNGKTGSANGTDTAASFFLPSGLAVDGAGNVYVADWGDQLIRKISPSGVVTTLAGNGNRGSANGTDTVASFYEPAGVAVDEAGNVYVADQHNDLIRMISPLGVVSTLAGSGAHGSDNGESTAASFNIPNGVAVDSAGNVYVADEGNNLIRKISPSGGVTWLAGTGQTGSANGAGYAASFKNPSGVAVDGAGNVYVADKGNNLIRRITQ
jgi:serine/threonine-protein kinase